MSQSNVRVINTKRVTRVLFNEMLNQVSLLLTLRGGCSEEEIKDQFRNLNGSLVNTFLSKAIERNIIAVDSGGTYTLQKKVPYDGSDN